jgi:hypothetical protein
MDEGAVQEKNNPTGWNSGKGRAEPVNKSTGKENI